MNLIDAGFVLLLLSLGVALFARQLKTPTPIIFALFGILFGVVWHLVPSLPPLRIPPDQVLFIFLPPLLTNAAYRLPWPAFRRNLLAISLLAVGLVLVTMTVSAVVGHWAAGLPWAAAFVLGAIVAPPDPVTATSVGGNSGLPHRLIAILEGEGLVNDAVAIVAYGVALDTVRTGHFDTTSALWDLVRQGPLGIGAALVVGWGARWVRKGTDSVPLEVGISLFTPYLAYHVADRLGGSGVLAVVTLGFLLRRYSREISAPAARLAARTVWASFAYASTALVFLLLGMLLGEYAIQWPDAHILWAGLLLAAAVIIIRLLWMWSVPRITERLGHHRPHHTSGREQTVLGWSGMRGVVSLSLALALPVKLSAPDSVRKSIIFMTFMVIFVTLVLQGGTLLPLIKKLGVGDPKQQLKDERRARKRARQAGLDALQAAVKDNSGQGQRLTRLLEDGSVGIAEPGSTVSHPDDQKPLRAALDAQRAVVDDLRDNDQLGEAVAERLDTELDLEEALAGSEAHLLTSIDEE